MRNVRRVGFCGALFGLVLVALWGEVRAEEQQGALAPLSAEMRAALAVIRSDPHPEQIIRNVHYVTSNEARVTYFRDVVTNVGGIQIGVGAEQNYLLAGWSRPELLICMDFDQHITDIHTLYGIFFAAAEDADALVALWEPKNEGARTLVEEAVTDPGTRKKLLRVLRRSGGTVFRHLTRQQRRYAKADEPTWLTATEQFTYLKSLWAAGRVVPLRGDLTGPRTLQDIATFARRFALPVRLFYLSNAEYYFKYFDGSFRDNVAALPVDDRSVVLHTHPTQKDYRYYFHSGANFRAWATHPRVKWFRTVKQHADDAGKPLFFVIRKEPADVPGLQPKKKGTPNS